MTYPSIQFARPLDPLPEAKFYVVLMPHLFSWEISDVY
jgi:hypothetical protein